MKNNQAAELQLTAVFYGALWGILEASLGHFLHYIPLPLSGFIMFPLAYLLMRRAFRVTGDSRVIFLMGFIAAGIKLVDLAIPGLPAVKTINPAMALLIEAMAVGVFYSVRMPQTALVPRILGINFSWRLFFLGFAFLIDRFTSAEVGLVQSSRAVFIFLLLNGILSAVLTLVFHLLEEKISEKSEKKEVQEKRPLAFRPLASLAGITGALVLQILW